MASHDKNALGAIFMELAQKEREFCTRIIQETNWPELHRQKLTMLNVANEYEEGDKRHERLWKLAEFISEIQDVAVDVYGLSEAQVFDNQEAEEK